MIATYLPGIRMLNVRTFLCLAIYNGGTVAPIIIMGIPTVLHEWAEIVLLAAGNNMQQATPFRSPTKLSPQHESPRTPSAWGVAREAGGGWKGPEEGAPVSSLGPVALTFFRPSCTSPVHRPWCTISFYRPWWTLPSHMPWYVWEPFSPFTGDPSE